MGAIVVIDDLRAFADGREAEYARTSIEGLALLQRFRDAGSVIAELWLDHDLGENDDIKPVVRWLAEQAVNKRSPKIKRIFVHTGNPSAATTMVNQLKGYYPSVVRRDALIVHLVVLDT